MDAEDTSADEKVLDGTHLPGDEAVILPLKGFCKPLPKERTVVPDGRFPYCDSVADGLGGSSGAEDDRNSGCHDAVYGSCGSVGSLEDDLENKLKEHGLECSKYTAWADVSGIPNQPN